MGRKGFIGRFVVGIILIVKQNVETYIPTHFKKQQQLLECTHYR